MHFASSLAAGAALVSVATAGVVCKPKNHYGNGWSPAPAPKPPVYHSGNNNGWVNWNGSPMIIRTTTMAGNKINPQATDGPKYGNGWQPANPGGPVVVSPPPPQVWGPWETYTVGPTAATTLTLSPIIPTTGLPTTTSGSGVVSPTFLTTSSTTLTTIVTSTITSAPTTTTTATTTTTTTATTTSACPNAPAGTFVLRATNAENTALEGLYAGLANNGAGNLVAFSEATAATAVQVTFDVNCNLVSAVGPLIVLDNVGEFSAIHYQYMNFPGVDTPGLDARTDVCAADASNVLSCNVGGQTILQTSDDILSIGDALYYQAVTVVLEAVVV